MVGGRGAGTLTVLVRVLAESSVYNFCNPITVTPIITLVDSHWLAGRSTVKLLYRNCYIKTTHWNNTMWSLHTQVVFICRFNKMDSISLGTCKMWPLSVCGLYIQVFL